MPGKKKSLKEVSSNQELTTNEKIKEYEELVKERNNEVEKIDFKRTNIKEFNGKKVA